MLRTNVLAALLLVHLAAVGSACERERLAESDIEIMCRALVRCWYPDDMSTQFNPNSPRWRSMAEPKNIQNIRHTYGADGSCWYADPMAGTRSDGAEVTKDALAVGCGASCACAILELCFARDDDADPAPECAAGVADNGGDPCELSWYPEGYAELCPACSVGDPPAYCAGLVE